MRSEWPNSRSSGNEDYSPEEWHDAQGPGSWDSSDPNLLWRVIYVPDGPISGFANDHGVPFLSWNRNRSERVPFKERVVRDASEASRDGFVG